MAFPLSEPYTQGASPWTPGSFLFGFGASRETVNVYIDASNGSDQNSGQDPTEPIQTLRALYRKFPLQAFPGARIIVHLAGVGGFGSNATARQDYPAETILAGNLDARLTAAAPIGDAALISTEFSGTGPV